MNVAAAHRVQLHYSLPHLENPPVRSDKFLLLTIGGVICTGPWQGALGERYVAWALMPKTDKSITNFIATYGHLLPSIRKIDNGNGCIEVTYLNGKTDCFL